MIPISAVFTFHPVESVSFGPFDEVRTASTPIDVTLCKMSVPTLVFRSY